MTMTLGAIGLQAQAPGADFSFFIPMIAIFLIFYLLLIRPQQRRQKEQEKQIAAIKGERVRIKVARARIDSVSKAKGGEES